MEYLKNATNEPIYIKQKLSHKCRKKNLMDAKGRKMGRDKLGVGVDIYILLYMKDN